MRYIVKPVVCDYGVFEKTDNGEQLKVICNSLSNAELIADILNTDLENTKYKMVASFKINKAIEEIEQTLYVDSLIFGELCDFKNGKISADDVIEEFNRVTRIEVLEILKRNIGE